MPLFVRPDVGPSATAIGRFAAPPEVALPVIAEIALPRLFVRWGPFPAVRSVVGQTGAWDHVGATRRPQLADGGEVTETIVEHRPGVGFAYELLGFTDVFDRLIVGVRGEWSGMPDGEGSVVRWTWEFQPRPGRRRLVATTVVPLWQQYMRRMMRTTETITARILAGQDAPGA